MDLFPITRSTCMAPNTQIQNHSRFHRKVFVSIVLGSFGCSFWSFALEVRWRSLSSLPAVFALIRWASTRWRGPASAGACGRWRWRCWRRRRRDVWRSGWMVVAAGGGGVGWRDGGGGGGGGGGVEVVGGGMEVAGWRWQGWRDGGCGVEGWWRWKWRQGSCWGVGWGIIRGTQGKIRVFGREKGVYWGSPRKVIVFEVCDIKTMRHKRGNNKNKKLHSEDLVCFLQV